MDSTKEELEIQLSAAIEVNQHLAREVERLALEVDSLRQQLKAAREASLAPPPSLPPPQPPSPPQETAPPVHVAFADSTLETSEPEPEPELDPEIDVVLPEPHGTTHNQLQVVDKKDDEPSSPPPPAVALPPLSQEAQEMQAFYKDCIPGLNIIPSTDIFLGSLLGEGSFGSTYKASWRSQEVAVKMVRVEDAAADAFAREVSALSQVTHPNIVKLYGACIEPPSRCWLVCEYLSGGPLSLWLYGGKGSWAPRRSLAQRLQVALDIASGMSVLESHEPPILHRDLKPANILLDEAGRACVADFGLSRILTPDALVSLTPETGSYLWMAPEMVRHDLYLGPADVWSFGVMLVELLTQTRPYVEHHLTPVQVALAVADGEMKPAIPADCPPALAAALRAVFHIEPMARPSFAALCAMLRHVLNEVQDKEQAGGGQPKWHRWLKQQ